MKTRLRIAFAMVCLLSASGWILDQVSPDVLSGPLRIAAHQGLLAIIFWIASLRWGGKRSAMSSSFVVGLIVIGVAWLALPGILIAAAGGTVASLTELLLFTLIPAIVVFLAAQSSESFGSLDNPLRLLLPALAGFGGAAMLIPFTWPVSTAGRLWLVAIVVSVILVGTASIRLHSLLQATNLIRAAAIVCGASAIFAAIFFRAGGSALGEWTASAALIELARCLLLDGPVMLLTLWLLREMSPVAASSRYLLIPLITLVEGFVFERPRAHWTIFAGAILMAASGFLCLRGDPTPERDSPL